MKRPLRYGFLLFVLCMAANEELSAQSEHSYHFPAQKIFKNAKIQAYSGEWIRSQAIQLLPQSDAIGYTLAGQTKNVELHLKEINSIEVQKGSNALMYGLLGAGVGMSVFYVINEANDWDNPFNDVSSSKIASTFFVCTSIGTGIGIAVGIGKKKYKKIYMNGNFVVP